MTSQHRATGRHAARKPADRNLFDHKVAIALLIAVIWLAMVLVVVW